MYCSNCGKELLNGANFCNNCGQAIWRKAGIYNERNSFSNSQKGIESHRLLNDYLNRVTINAIIWLLIGICQLLISGVLFLFVSVTDISSWFILIVGIFNISEGILRIKSKKEILEKPVGIVAEHKIDGGLFGFYIWNIIIGVLCFYIGSYFIFLLAFLLVATDFFLIKLFVVSHKQEFLELEEKYKVEEEEKHVLS